MSASTARALDGRTVLVTGAGRNIGRGVALAFARAGANVVLCGYRHSDHVAETATLVDVLDVATLCVEGDVGDPDDAFAIAAAALERFGRIDILINNAATRPAHAFDDMSLDDWHRVINVDLNAAFYLAKALVPGMSEGGWGRIVNMAGMHAMDGYDGRSHVSVAKHGIWGMTKALAKELGPRGITVNTISPGTIRSERDDPDMEAAIEKMAERIPVRRLGTPEDMGALAVFLASDAGGFINGQLIAANGGAST